MTGTCNAGAKHTVLHSGGQADAAKCESENENEQTEAQKRKACKEANRSAKKVEKVDGPEPPKAKAKAKGQLGMAKMLVSSIITSCAFRADSFFIIPTTAVHNARGNIVLAYS